jgi:hypothetical protein
MATEGPVAMVVFPVYVSRYRAAKGYVFGARHHREEPTSGDRRRQNVPKSCARLCGEQPGGIIE